MIELSLKFHSLTNFNMPKLSQLFNSVKANRPKLNKFDLGHERKMSCNMAELVPMFVQEVLPGDKFRVNTEIMMRLAPMLAPVMHRVNVWTHYFFVPNRLVWSEWEDFITGGREGTSAPVAPYINVKEANKTEFLTGSLADYLGFPASDMDGGALTQEIPISALPFRAYQLIYDEFYRDQNVQASIAVSKTSGLLSDAETTKVTTIRKRAWEKDYFTSALPFAQRGPDVLVPINGFGDTVVSALDGDPAPADRPLGVLPASPGQLAFGDSFNPGVNTEAAQILVENTETTINDLRRSLSLQKWLERNARGGARYVEQLLMHFGVIADDARLQRPEYLGGGMQPVRISEVLQTSESGTDPLGTMAGHGVSVGSRNGFSSRFKEHGFVIGVMSVLPRTAYQQGVPKYLSRFDKFDYAWPEFANIGEQEVKVGELWYDPQAAAGEVDETFGYQSRYADYKYSPSTVHGDFRTTLSFWHEGRIFDAKPVLNTTFISADPSYRIFAVDNPDEDHLWVQLYNKVDALRPLPYFGTPSL